ncbi:hypothetical protein JCM17380_27210 [Desulfosporosinus burensis]
MSVQIYYELKINIKTPYPFSGQEADLFTKNMSYIPLLKEKLSLKTTI